MAAKRTTALEDLASRVDYLERQNRLLKRAMAVLFALVGIALILIQVTTKQHEQDLDHVKDGQDRPTIEKEPPKPGGSDALPSD
jgi:hypothetical protein